MSLSNVSASHQHLKTHCPSIGNLTEMKEKLLQADEIWVAQAVENGWPIHCGEWIFLGELSAWLGSCCPIAQQCWLTCQEYACVTMGPRDRGVTWGLSHFFGLGAWEPAKY